MVFSDSLPEPLITIVDVNVVNFGKLVNLTILLMILVNLVILVYLMIYVF